MEFFKNYYISVVKYDLINKFNYKILNKIPVLKKITLHFSFATSDFKLLSICSLGLELLSGQKGKLTRAKKGSLLLKIRRGNPVGCKVILANRAMMLFLSKLILEVLPKMKLTNFITYKDKSSNTISASFKINNTLIFSEFEKNYYIFNKLSNLQVNFLTSAKTESELIYLLNCFKIPFAAKYS